MDEDDQEKGYSFLEDFREAMKEGDRRKRAIDMEYKRLAADPCMIIPEVGDSVIINAGLVGKGNLWDRLEAIVLKVADTSYYIEYVDYTQRDFDTKQDNVVREWISNVVVVDVIKKDRNND